MLVAFTNTKGGVGKSTLAAHLAIWLYDQGYRVALLDTDIQQSSAPWVRAAEPAITVATAFEMEQIQKACEDLRRSHEIVVVDTPGKENDASHTVPFLVDLTVLPLQPSKLDLRAVKDALKSIRLAQQVTGGKRPEAVFVLYLTAKGDVQTRILREQLAASGFPVAGSEVRRLNALRDACDSAVTRLRPSEAREAKTDIHALFMELLGDRLTSMKPEQSTSAKRIKAANE